MQQTNYHQSKWEYRYLTCDQKLAEVYPIARIPTHKFTTRHCSLRPWSKSDFRNIRPIV